MSPPPQALSSAMSFLSLWQDIAAFFLCCCAERVFLLTKLVCSDGEKTSATSDFLDMVYLQTLLVAMNTSWLVDALMGKVKLYEGYSLFSPKEKGPYFVKVAHRCKSPRGWRRTSCNSLNQNQSASFKSSVTARWLQALSPVPQQHGTWHMPVLVYAPA